MSVIENKQETRKPAKKSFDFKTAEIRFFRRQMSFREMARHVEETREHRLSTLERAGHQCDQVPILRLF
jgi:transposase-like protein